MNTLDLQRLNKGLAAGTQLTGVAVVVQSVDRQDGPAVFLSHYMADECALEAPVVTVLHLLVDDAFRIVLLCEAVCGVTALHDLFVGYVTCALGVLHYMAAKLSEDGLFIVELNDLAARSRAEAVTVAGALDKLGKIRIVDLGADDRNSCTEPGLGIGLAGLELFESLLQVRENESLRAGEGNEVQYMILIAGDNGVFSLAPISVRILHTSLCSLTALRIALSEVSMPNFSCRLSRTCFCIWISYASRV